MAPRISVLMTVYNGGVALKPSIESILNQTEKDFEFIVVDNASTDETVPYLKQLSDPRLRIIFNETNLGQTRALNKGIGEAKGEFLARMDADDVSSSDRLATQREFLDLNPKAGVVGSWHDEIDENDRLLKQMAYPTDPLEIKCHLLSDGNLTRRCFAHPTAFFRTAALREMGGYDESVRFAQDYELWTRFVLKYDICNIGRSLLSYRVSRKSTSNTNRSAMELELDRIVGLNISRLWPDIEPCNHMALLQMLRNKPVDPPLPLSTLHHLFDRLFERLFRPEKPSDRALQIRDRIKLYYTPRLMARQPLRSILHLGERSLQQPDFWFDSKMQKNFLKVLFRK